MWQNNQAVIRNRNWDFRKYILFAKFYGERAINLAELCKLTYENIFNEFADVNQAELRKSTYENILMKCAADVNQAELRKSTYDDFWTKMFRYPARTWQDPNTRIRPRRTRGA